MANPEDLKSSASGNCTRLGVTGYFLYLGVTRVLLLSNRETFVKGYGGQQRVLVVYHGLPRLCRAVCFCRAGTLENDLSSVTWGHVPMQLQPLSRLSQVMSRRWFWYSGPTRRRDEQLLLHSHLLAKIELKTPCEFLKMCLPFLMWFRRLCFSVVSVSRSQTIRTFCVCSKSSRMSAP